MNPQENINQIFLYLNRGLQTLINDVLVSGEYPIDMKSKMLKVCYDIIDEHNIELKTHIITLVDNRVKQYMKLYNLKVKYAN